MSDDGIGPAPEIVHEICSLMSPERREAYWKVLVKAYGSREVTIKWFEEKKRSFATSSYIGIHVSDV